MEQVAIPNEFDRTEEEVLVHEWRTAQLERLGITRVIAEAFASDFPTPEKLYEIADLGGWGPVNDSLFDPDKGSVAKIYDEATS